MDALHVLLSAVLVTGVAAGQCACQGVAVGGYGSGCNPVFAANGSEKVSPTALGWKSTTSGATNRLQPEANSGGGNGCATAWPPSTSTRATR